MEDEGLERQQVCYEQNCENFRDLNRMMWQVPMMAMTLTGGLWYGIGTIEEIDVALRTLLLSFAAVANVALVLVIQRVRSVMDAYLGRIREFCPPSFADSRHAKHTRWLPEGGVCNTFSVFLCVSALMNAAGIFLLA